MPPLPIVNKDVKTSKQAPLPLSATLADLAAIKAAQIDLKKILPPPSDVPGTPTDITLEASYEFVRNARAALDIQKHGAVDMEGEKMEKIREQLEDVLNGLKPAE
ncbi:hypothetical protein FRB94_014236 [Tulasnella sp. JGI-2019a]|nr:hypothetical protein FRB93_005418 [Tulasnella sp. JGI-2019a]KAG9014143.1 hypothetical protein FRB94_014236 [Tulasnella sp. JGI-2019a]KAG9028232.1 hypothetical protein FRB95_006733 [Tulasnella sp. JGI-2019a]